jgi:site-specific recombinase XerD
MADEAALVPAGTAALSTVLLKTAERAGEYARQAKAPNTLRAYRADWADFEGFCQAHGLEALPATDRTVALYLTERAAMLRTSTLQRRLSAIAQAHKAAGHVPPTKGRVSMVWQGIRRAKGTAQKGKAPARTEEIRRMVATCGEDLLGTRDRALLLLGFAGAFRRSELVGLDVADLHFGRDGLTVTLRRSKTDQEGAGQKVGIPYGSTPATCPVRNVRAWLEAAQVTAGPVFRGVNRWGQVSAARLTDRAVALVVKRRAEAAGLDPAQYAGHSLRAGLATAAAEAGVSERVIMAQTRHRSLPMVRRYIRDGNLFRENAAAAVGL